MSLSLFTITIPNWSKFNPRSDRSNFTWFRLQNDFFHDQALFSLSYAQKCLYLFLLCEASKKNKGEIRISVGYVAAIMGAKESEISKDIQRLFDAGLVTTESRHDDGVTPPLLHATDETDETNETRRTDIPANKPAAPDPDDLVLVWNSNCGALPKVERLTDKRRKAAKSRLADHPDLTYWQAVIAKLAASSFCRGDNKTGWQATFDFLVKPDTHVKAMEGQYDQGTRKTWGRTENNQQALGEYLEKLGGES